jgi:hypothetical protein
VYGVHEGRTRLDLYYKWKVDTYILVWGEAAPTVNSCCGSSWAPTLEPLLEWPPEEGKLIRDGKTIWEK